MELPERIDRVIEESKNPLQEDTNVSKGESHSFLSYIWTTPSLRDNKQQRIKLKQSPDVIEDNESGYRMSIQGMSSLNVISREISVKKKTDENTDLLFTSYSVHFDWAVFFEEFLINSLYPFTCWVNPYMHSWYDFSSFMKVLLTHGTAIMMIMLIVGTYMAGNIDDGEYVLPLVMYLLHKIVVALKYASLFPEEYSKLKSARDNVTVQSYQQQVQMIASWLGTAPI